MIKEEKSIIQPYNSHSYRKYRKLPRLKLVKFKVKKRDGVVIKKYTKFQSNSAIYRYNDDEYLFSITQILLEIKKDLVWKG